MTFLSRSTRVLLATTKCLVSSSRALHIERITVQEFHTILQDESKRKNFQIVDVREPSELAISKLSGDDIINIPMSSMQKFVSDVENDDSVLVKSKPIVCMCHHGVRSYRFGSVLTSLGFEKIYNVEGGIDSYAREADNTVPLY